MEKQCVKTYLSPEMVEKLTRLATADGVSVSTLVGTLISKALSPGEGSSKNVETTDNGLEQVVKPIPGRLMYLRFLMEECINQTDPSGAAVKRARERFDAERARQGAERKGVSNG